MSLPSSNYDPAAGNSGPGGPFTRPVSPIGDTPPTPYPLIARLDEMTWKVTTYRHKTLIEKRVEVYQRGAAEPILTLSANDARALGYILRRLATEADH